MEIKISEKTKSNTLLLDTIVNNIDASPSEINDKFIYLIAPEKAIVYSLLYKNFSKPIVNQIHFQLERIYYAKYGYCRAYSCLLSEKKEISEKVFDISKKTGIFKIFKERYMKHLLSNPSGIIKVKGSGIEFINATLINSIYFENDTISYIEYVKNKAPDYLKGKTVEYADKDQQFVYISNDLADFRDLSLRESPISNVLHQITNFNTFCTFCLIAEAKTAFPKIISMELENTKTPNQPLGGIGDPNFQSPKNANTKDFFGQEIQIPFNMTLNNEMDKDFKKMFFEAESNVDGLDYRDKRLRDMKKEILKSVLGHSFGTAQEDSTFKTATEIEAGFVTQENVLKKISKNASITYSNILTALCKIKLKESTFSIDFSFGDKFFLKQESTLVNEYKDLKAAGAPLPLIEQKEQEIANSQKHSTDLRIEIIKRIQPFPNFKPSEVLDMAKNNLITNEKFAEYYDFEKNLANFEADFKNRIENLTNPINTYKSWLRTLAP